ncbi:MAG TPA: hypothetical protein GX702_11675 [Chloroflexi bacterium]|nr:hypothetical protein [Chloroflexota bacterium]
MLRDPRFHRQLILRIGWTTMVAIIGYFFLDIDVRVWLLPVGGVLLLMIRWIAAPRDPGDEMGEPDGNEYAPPDESP